MGTPALVIAILGMLIYFFAFGLYNQKMLTGKSVPNTATWALWAFLGILNAATYRVMTGSPIVSVQTYGAALMNFGTFIVALRFGKLARLGHLDRAILAIGMTAAITWAVSQNATWANMLIQLCIFISIIPTWKSVYQNPGTESPLPWLLFVLVYSVQIVVAAMTHQQWTAYVLPLNAGSIQLVVGLLALRHPRSPQLE